MLLSDTSIKRPVFASVLSLVLVIFGIVAFMRLPLREYPDIDAPVVNITTNYPGASADVVETRITRIIEDRIAGVSGIRFIDSNSTDGRSSISVEFSVNVNIDAAANDIRDRVATVLNNLPTEADPPEIQKADNNEDVVMWMNLASDSLTTSRPCSLVRRPRSVPRFDFCARTAAWSGSRASPPSPVCTLLP